MTEIKAPEAQWIDRRNLLRECDRYIKSCESAERKQAVKEMAVWVMGAVTPDLRSDVKATKVVTQYGLLHHMRGRRQVLPALRREVRMSEEARKREDDYYAGTLKDDYISRKAVLDMLDKECGSCADTDYIFSLPGIEGRKGKWIKMSDADGIYWACSECGEDIPRTESIDKINYCPNCGADMRGVTNA